MKSSSQVATMASPATTTSSDFSIEHILTRAGERYRKRRKLSSEDESFGVRSSTSYCHSESPSHSDDSEARGGSSEEDEEIVVEDRRTPRVSVAALGGEPEVDRNTTASATTTSSYLQNCMPSFDWLYYTRYRPPKLPRPQKAGPVKRTPGRLPRVPFTPSQLSALEDAYKVSTYLSSEEANQLAYSLELTNTRVKIWFQNRRARDRREKREAAEGGAPPAVGGHFAFFGGASPSEREPFLPPMK
ncbi:homeobox protein engrailed-like ceh-16 [Culex quinquefasciatus]|uniref:homeobox protein engrailed-like ceh-16 n=1 Tax=Culex quinquefasciatus TaxID=7176 RepID=UPI0018E34899|nr:homeobox protein engrailed-like ceh-16 [Culex quinquefasciatus]